MLSSRHLNEQWTTKHPTCMRVFTHFLVFVFVLYILKAIQKEKSNVAIKFAGTLMIYILFYFLCNNDKKEMEWSLIAFLNCRRRS